MRRIFLFSLMMVLIFSSHALAKKNPQFTVTPSNFTCDAGADPVLFDWDEWTNSGTPTKYSIDVELLVSGTDWSDPEADIQQLSFGTSDRTDGEAINATFLDVPYNAFIYYDGEYYLPFSGDARAKVKALGKGSIFNSQNNTFSDWCNFSIPAAE